MNHPFPRYAPSHTKCLNGIWQFAYLGDVHDVDQLTPEKMDCQSIMAVPGVFDASPEFAGKRGVGLYRTQVEITPGRHAQLRFDGLGLWARLFVDGQPLGTFDLPYSGWRVRIPPSPSGKRQIDVLIDNRLHPQRTVLVEPYFDFYLYGGIYRGVWLREWEGAAVDQLSVKVLDYKKGRVAITLNAFENVPDNTPLHVGVDDAPLTLISDAVWVGHTLTYEMDVPDPRPWSAADPYLHQLTINLGSDLIMTRFGLRTIRIDGAKLLLNDEPLKLKGICRHESHAQFGPALPDAQIVHDVQLLKRLGCNFVRGSHYPQDPRFLDLCDEQGLMVFEESLGWNPRLKHFQNPGFVDHAVTQAQEMVRSSMNHPSVILWGFFNEGDSDQPASRQVYQRVIQAIREEDSTRPVTYATNRPLIDINLDLVDVISANLYPGWYADPDSSGVRPLDEIAPKLDQVFQHLAGKGLNDRPFILSEIGAGAIYGWHDPLNNHWSEEYQADLIEEVCRIFRKDERMVGLAIWQFCDGRTYANSRALMRPRSFNNKGIFDEYRRPKLAAKSFALG